MTASSPTAELERVRAHAAEILNLPPDYTVATAGKSLLEDNVRLRALNRRLRASLEAHQQELRFYHEICRTLSQRPTPTPASGI